MQVRFEIDDRDVSEPKLDDAEIEHALATERNVWSASARCCEVIARGFLAKADVQLGRHLHVVYSTMARQYAEHAMTLRRKSLGTVAPWAGGLSLSEKQAVETDTDRVQPAFTRQMMDNPRSGGRSSYPVDWPGFGV